MTRPSTTTGIATVLGLTALIAVTAALPRIASAELPFRDG